MTGFAGCRLAPTPWRAERAVIDRQIVIIYVQVVVAVVKALTLET
jgi:hypothetical protein